jgi:hypothetical protein
MSVVGHTRHVRGFDCVFLCGAEERVESSEQRAESTEIREQREDSPGGLPAATAPSGRPQCPNSNKEISKVC